MSHLPHHHQAGIYPTTLTVTCYFLSFPLEVIFKSSPSLEHESPRSPLSGSALRHERGCFGFLLLFIWFGVFFHTTPSIVLQSWAPDSTVRSPRRTDCPFRGLDGLALILHLSQKINDSVPNWLSNSIGRPAAVSGAAKTDGPVLQGQGFNAGQPIFKAI